MRIEKIELNGFKSFAERTVFTFHPGITCFVGPNGCGKSNIVDAFRWVLGEQSAKSLRGEKMEEVIFNGSQTKKPRGMAEVTLHVAGLYTEEQDNGDSTERPLTITRRLYRSGESEYLINRRICRLKDIREIFLDTGLEMKSYSVMEQGRIGEIINARPQDRRFLIEEVAGIMKYKVRKVEARNKLELSRQNLQRVSDIISEVKRQLASIDRQARRAERYKRLLDDLREVELRLMKKEYVETVGSLEELAREIDVLRTEEAGKRAAMTGLEASLQQKRLLILEREKETEALAAGLQTVEKRIAEFERRIAVNRTETEHLRGRITALGRQLKEGEGLLEVKRGRLKGITEEEESLGGEIDSLRETISGLEAGLSEAEEGLASIEDEIDDKRREVFRVTDRLGSLRNDLNRLEATLEGDRRRLAASGREAEEAERRLSELEEELEGIEARLEAAEADLRREREKREGYLNELTGLKERLQALGRERSELREELASLRTRARSLQDTVTGRVDREVFHREGIETVASLSEVVEVEQRYEKAVEAALSERLKGFIVPSTDEIRRSADVVRREGLPRTALILWRRERKERGVPEGLRPLASFVRARPEYAPVVDSLLRGCFLTDDIDAALGLLERLEGMDARAVTLEGEIVEPSGAVLCGREQGILRLKRELRETLAAVEERSEALSRVEKEAAEAEERTEELKASITGTEQGIISHEKELSLLRAAGSRLEEERERFEKKLQFIRLEMEELQRGCSGVEAEIAGKKEEISAQEARKGLVESELASLQEELSEARSDLDARRHTLTELKVELNGYTERLRAIVREREGLETEIQEALRRQARLAEEMEAGTAELREREEGSAELEEGLKAAVSEADALTARISGMREAVREEKREMLEAEESLKGMRAAVEGLGNEIHRKELLKTELELRLSGLAEGAREKYRVDLAAAEIAAEATDEDRERARELKEKIQAMGSVSLGTLEEYRDLKERYRFLTEQHDDIVQSVAELEEAIARINRTTRKRLREAFESLNAKFDEVFKVLFGGGHARLRLTEEADILEAGIEITAQPPGKRLQNLNLLSGGEKALTALALLFAGFLLKPTPLCILDEADAPLDENNTERFKAMLKELSEGIQFIIVTHNRMTMEAADYLYGITMEEPGVSRVLSMEFV